MSLHYDVALACDLKPQTPQQVLDTLAYLTRTADYAFDAPPAHPAFAALEINGVHVEDWRIMLQDRDTRFPGGAGGCLRRASRFSCDGAAEPRYTLSFRQEVLDDTMGAYLALIEWLAPYSATEGFVGYVRSEGAAHPTLLYFKQGQVYLSQVTQTPHPLATGAPSPTEG